LISRLKINYLLIPLFAIITASAASYFADVGMVWYKTINVPDWTPSNSLMVIAWTMIFVLSSISVLLIWNKYSSVKNFGLVISLFSLNAVLVVGWNILFFGQQLMGLAFFQAILLVADLVLLIVLIWRFCPFAAFLLLPYSLWVSFATVLTFNVWMIN
jgi:tryptophan-rich sensory protein